MVMMDKQYQNAIYNAWKEVYLVIYQLVSLYNEESFSCNFSVLEWMCIHFIIHLHKNIINPTA